MNLSRFLPLLCLAASCAPSPTPLTDAERDAAETEVRATSEALLAALNSHDADSILSFYSLEEDFTYVPCTDVMTGGDFFAGLARSLHASYRDAVYTLRVESVRVPAPDMAVVSLRGSMLAPLFITRVFRREGDGRWRVVWEHESWPGCPDPTAPHPGTLGSDSISDRVMREIP